MSDRTIVGRAFVGGAIQDDTLVTIDDGGSPTSRRRRRFPPTRSDVATASSFRDSSTCTFTAATAPTSWTRRDDGERAHPRLPRAPRHDGARGDDALRHRARSAGRGRRDRARVAHDRRARRSAASISKGRTSTPRAPARRTAPRSAPPTSTSSRRCSPRRRGCAG